MRSILTSASFRIISEYLATSSRWPGSDRQSTLFSRPCQSSHVLYVYVESTLWSPYTYDVDVYVVGQTSGVGDRTTPGWLLLLMMMPMMEITDTAYYKVKTGLVKTLRPLGWAR